MCILGWSMFVSMTHPKKDRAPGQGPGSAAGNVGCEDRIPGGSPPEPPCLVGQLNETASRQQLLDHAALAPDEVLVPGNTFIATWLSVSHLGATPVPVEPDPTTGNLDPARVEAALTPRTRAIVPVHLYGLMVDMPPLLDVARRRSLPVVEDAAQAIGAKRHDKPACSMGFCGCLSFYPTKNLGALGDGGALLTNDDGIASTARSLRNYGQASQYIHAEIGLNSRRTHVERPHLFGLC